MKPPCSTQPLYSGLVMNSMTALVSGSSPLNTAATSPPPSTAEHRPVVGSFTGELEDAHEVVHVGAHRVGEEALLGDEVGLAVHEAAGRAVEHRVRRGREVVAGDRGAPTQHVAVREGHSLE